MFEVVFSKILVEGGRWKIDPSTSSSTLDSLRKPNHHLMNHSGNEVIQTAAILKL